MNTETEVFRLEKVTKCSGEKEQKVKALDEVSLSIYEGEIFGIIGMSGAGKSTLVRTLNRLEEITDGKIFFFRENLGDFSGRQLRKVRQSMAMVFQGFNLLMQKTVLDNVLLPMKIAGWSHKEQRKKALEMLKIVGLEEKAKVYPAQLSARVFGTAPFQYTEEESALVLSDKLKDFFVHLGLKVTLKELEIGREHFSEMAERATKGGTQTVGHYVFLSQKEILDILETAEPK